MTSAQKRGGGPKNENVMHASVPLPFSIGDTRGAVSVDVALAVVASPLPGTDVDLPLLQPRLLLTHVPLHDLEHAVPLLQALPPGVPVLSRPRPPAAGRRSILVLVIVAIQVFGSRQEGSVGVAELLRQHFDFVSTMLDVGAQGSPR